MLYSPFYQFLVAVLAVSSWLVPQPKYSEGLLENYGGQSVVLANAQWHNYSLDDIPGRCGMASVSPRHLGQIVWVSVDRIIWYECVVVDVGGRNMAVDAIFGRHEIGEIPRWLANKMGFEYGHHGYMFFGKCPPNLGQSPQPYTVPYVLDRVGEWTPSMYPYPKREIPIECDSERFYHGGP